MQASHQVCAGEVVANEGFVFALGPAPVFTSCTGIILAQRKNRGVVLHQCSDIIILKNIYDDPYAPSLTLTASFPGRSWMPNATMVSQVLLLRCRTMRLRRLRLHNGSLGPLPPFPQRRVSPPQPRHTPHAPHHAAVMAASYKGQGVILQCLKDAGADM